MEEGNKEEAPGNQPAINQGGPSPEGIEAPPTIAEGLAALDILLTYLK